MKTLCLISMALSLLAAESLPDLVARGVEMEAESRWEEAKSIYQGLLSRGSMEPRVRLWLLTSLAELEFERQNYVQAEHWLKESEKVSSQFSENAPERIRLLNASASLLLVQGHLKPAKRRLLDLLQRTDGSANSVIHAAALHNLAAIETHLGRVSGAIRFEKQALDIWQRCLGERSHSVWKALISLSSMQGLDGDWPAAEQSMRRAIAIHESPEALANYATILKQLNRGKEAEAIRHQLNRSFPKSVSIDAKHYVQQHGLDVRTR